MNSEITDLQLKYTTPKHIDRKFKIYEYYKKHGWRNTRSNFRIHQSELQEIILSLRETPSIIPSDGVIFGHKTEAYFDNELDYATPKPTRHGYNPFNT